METDCEIGETVTESFIHHTEPIKNRFQIFETSLCFKISKNKFHCIMLFLVITLTFLQIVKVALPAMAPEDMKMLAKTFTRTFKRLNSFLKLNLNTTTNNPNLNVDYATVTSPDLIVNYTTITSLEYD